MKIHTFKYYLINSLKRSHKEPFKISTFPLFHFSNKKAGFLVEAHPHKELKRKVTVIFDKMKNEYKTQGYVKSKFNLTKQSNSRFGSIYVTNKNLTAATNYVHKQLVTKSDDYVLCAETKLV